MDDKEKLEQLRLEFNNNTAERNKLTTQVDEIRELIRQAQEEVRTLLKREDDLRLRNRDVSWDIKSLEDKVKKDDAEAIRRQALQPHLDHPRLQFLMRILEMHPKYEMLKQFQKEDLVFMLDRWLFPLATKGILNGNDTGLGKTAETAIMLACMEAYERMLAAGKVPEEALPVTQ